MIFRKSKKRESQSRFLSQAMQLEEGINSSLIRITMVIVSSAIIAFIGWAAVTNINEVARTPGEAMPQGFEQVVQHLEGGIVREIRVREGQAVDKNEIVMVLDGSGSQEDLARATEKQISLDMQGERLRAFLEGREPDFSAYQKSHPALVHDQTAFFNGMIDAREQERKVINEQVMQKRRTIVTLESDIETVRGNYQITKDLYDRRLELNRKGYASDIQFLETKQSLNNVEGEMRQLKNRISVANSEIAEFQNRLKSLDASYRGDANERLDQLMAEKAQNAEIVGKMKDRVARLEIRAPARGIVKGLTVNTIGAVVQPGQVVMEVVPLDDQIIVQIKIPPQHIGHVKPGQKVQVKFSSFDFSRYGVVSGELSQISPATFTGDGGERYYQGRIRLDHNYVGHDSRNVIVPGMTVMAEIITGRKTVLDYLLKPIHIAMRTAFTER